MKNKPIQVDLSRFRSPSRDELISLDALVCDLVSFMADEPEESYVVGVGTDSKIYADKIVFVTAIFIHRVGKGARYFYNRFYVKSIMSLEERMYQEANLSLFVSQELSEILSSAILSLDMTEYRFEIHVDVGMNGDTRKVVKQIVGWLESCGFIVKSKPKAPCASTVADKYT